jgi:hypothetical protein
MVWNIDFGCCFWGRGGWQWLGSCCSMSSHACLCALFWIFRAAPAGGMPVGLVKQQYLQLCSLDEYASYAVLVMLNH